MTWTRFVPGYLGTYPKDGKRVQFVRTDISVLPETDVGSFDIYAERWSSDLLDVPVPELTAVTHWQPLAQPVKLERCDRCRGTGHWDPDGRGSMPCDVCEKTGLVERTLW